MMTILDHQMEILRRNALEIYEDRMAERLRREHPAAVAGMDEGALRNRIRAEIDDARRRGITVENEVTRRITGRFAARSGLAAQSDLAAPSAPDAPSTPAAPSGQPAPSAAPADRAPPQNQASPRSSAASAGAGGSRPRRLGDPVQPCLGWLEILLADEDGEPIPDERYVVTLPDGTKREGALDGQGRAYLVGIDPGTCQVSFPDMEVEKA